MDWARGPGRRATHRSGGRLDGGAGARATTGWANTSVHVGPDGELRGVYRKIHMFDVTVEGKDYRESHLPGAR